MINSVPAYLDRFEAEARPSEFWRSLMKGCVIESQNFPMGKWILFVEFRWKSRWRCLKTCCRRAIQCQRRSWAPFRNVRADLERLILTLETELQIERPLLILSWNLERPLSAHSRNVFQTGEEMNDRSKPWAANWAAFVKLQPNFKSLPN